MCYTIMSHFLLSRDIQFNPCMHEFFALHSIVFRFCEGHQLRNLTIWAINLEQKAPFAVNSAELAFFVKFMAFIMRTMTTWNGRVNQYSFRLLHKHPPQRMKYGYPNNQRCTKTNIICKYKLMDKGRVVGVVCVTREIEKFLLFACRSHRA